MYDAPNNVDTYLMGPWNRWVVVSSVAFLVSCALSNERWSSYLCFLSRLLVRVGCSNSIRTPTLCFVLCIDAYCRVLSTKYSKQADIAGFISCFILCILWSIDMQLVPSISRINWANRQEAHEEMQLRIPIRMSECNYWIPRTSPFTSSMENIPSTPYYHSTSYLHNTLKCKFQIDPAV